MATNMHKPEETSFLAGANAAFIEAIYEEYLRDPQLVEESWRRFFSNLGTEDVQALQHSLHARQPVWENQAIQEKPPHFHPAVSEKRGDFQDLQTARDTMRALQLIRAYRVRGHLKARLDPLGLAPQGHYAELEPSYYGFTLQDYNRPIFLDGMLGFQWANMHEILAALQRYYGGSIGIEYLHIQHPDEKSWIEQQIEAIEAYEKTAPQDQKIMTLHSLSRAATFEKFLQVKFPGAKRFGLEGGEAMIPALETILATSGRLGVRDVVIGMAHRGRLNVLTNVLGKPARAIMSKFQGHAETETQMQGSGDVKYHLGSSSDRDFAGTIMHLSLTSNPSHLEAVNPVVMGKVRAKQTRRGDVHRAEVLGVLIHGDAALAGQGLVAETLDLSDLRGYKTGGTIHFVINNQIGFTTSPIYSRSSAYCTDIGKKIQAPIFHVNGDDPDAVMYVSRVAAQYRARFKRDVFIDMVCYRRHGHNEMDEPSFTQPRMYKAIRERPPVHQLYGEQLIRQGIMSAEKPGQIVQALEQEWQAEFAAAESCKDDNDKEDWLEGAWTGLQGRYDPWNEVITGVASEILVEAGDALTRIPEGFALHPRLTRLIQARQEMFRSRQRFDWATAEALAFGTLLCEGYPIRLSGQDSGRGTFSQRHAVLIDQETDAPYVPLNTIRVSQEEVEIVDSPLSEAGVLGFEHGYSLADPHSLVLWEAQFGDFANGAQVIIDQFISAGEAKWLRLSGLVMLLPHGYEGQGPEHSSARLERYLQLCAEDNIQVANCSTPANYFHILRRQMLNQTRKPLVIMTPKSLLRHRLAVSSLEEMGSQTQFTHVYGEVSPHIDPAHVKRVVLCSGKVYYDLYEKREEAGIRDIAILRLEQYYPFPEKILKQHLSKYLQAEMIWCQEEPANMGAWSFIDRRLENVLRAIGAAYLRPNYVGRAASASTATGLYARHEREQKLLVAQALKLTL
jgi:2-oxoglutarate dehydrogenase E1 component